ncbi:hypothetical protein H310_06163 [Aphanomyces invadans]|uniref:Uncharacterized protein n=1 Tax=Aphanomyces invadans TaxID=157072 RepID=A0A024U5K5_9STRA|nr:hypothetical protein H310_06163 [Aphanomyces invadans]ETW01490.1 hypothetical protein H310_06163 [Aphanomyces invadans]|eukprot:XP_008869338.1 hypothetical protein H310_06163 [Aphanomyces invadans]
MDALYLKYVCPFKQYVSVDLIGGPRPIQFRYLINVQKGATFLFVLACMAYFDNWSWTAHVYLANHGIYGFIWLLKDITIPDASWKVYLTIPSAVVAVTGLGLYWVAGYIVVAHRVEASPSLAAVCIMLHTLGTTLMLAADTQKYFTLKYKKGLISDGWVTWSRNTNYLGEMMLYLSYALLANHWIPYAWLAFIWSAMFMSNMIAKDASLRKKEGGEAYAKKAGLLFPNVAGWAAATWAHAKGATPQSVKRA